MSLFDELRKELQQEFADLSEEELEQKISLPRHNGETSIAVQAAYDVAVERGFEPRKDDNGFYHLK